MEKENKKIKPKELILPAVLSLLLLSLLFLSQLFDGGRAENPQPKSKDIYGFFDTASRIYDYSGMTDGEFSELSALIEERLDLYHRLFDIYHSYSGITNIKDINDRAGGGATAVSPELFDFLEYAKSIHTLTEGEVNIAMGSVLSVWHEYREAGEKIPDKELLSEAAKHTDINALVLERDSLSVTLTDSEMSLDVGAVGKGYAAEMVAGELERLGYNSIVLDLGGNLRAIGAKPDGKGWKTGVRNPDITAEGYLYEFELSDGAAVTSGNYERYYTVDGKRYHHIIDKDTLMPSEHFVSVTVICPDSALADALSTALFNMTKDAGKELISRLENVKAVWLTSSGEVEISK